MCFVSSHSLAVGLPLVGTKVVGVLVGSEQNVAAARISDSAQRSANAMVELTYK